METTAGEVSAAAAALAEEEEEREAAEAAAVGAGGSGGGTGKKLKVLVAVDESQGSLYALTWALDNLFTSSSSAAASAANVDGVGVPDKSEQHGCRLILLHAQQHLHHLIHPVGPGYPIPTPAGVYATPGLYESVKKAQEENSRNLLDKASQMCKRRLVDAETVIVDGDPKEIICQVAEQMQVDLLVIGSRGLGMIKRAILGSVSDYCAHHAKCHILIVKPPKGKPT